MTNLDAKRLCNALLHADTSDDVVKLLINAGYWDDPASWRYYGDNENNFSTIGNQQSRPEAALVEKLVNSVDARLMNECMLRGIDPSGPNAPASIRDAVAQFFDDRPASPGSVAGLIQEWTNTKRTEVSRGITLAATGLRGAPSLSVYDNGEGQTPTSFPDTLLSLNRSNKLRIPFVQGKFNMGGTGVLKFCGKRHLQLVLSRRNPALLNESQRNSSDGDWGFTVIRRESPSDGVRSSMYTYLAPVNVKQGRDGAILHFHSDVLSLCPKGNNAYEVDAEWGTLLKLYEYSLPSSGRSHILMRDGLLSKINLLLPDVALPMRFHECRNYGGSQERSFENTLTGLRVRLDDNRGGNLEEQFPTSTSFMALGEEFVATTYAFRKGAAPSYRRNEGIIFTVNGQTHGHLTVDFFRRARVGMSHLADSVLVIVDCSRLSTDSREDLFMNSRDRLSNGELKAAIEGELQDLLKNHSGLRELRERRRREEVENRLSDDKPLEEVLTSLVSRSPTLASLFLSGSRSSNPFKSMAVGDTDTPFKGARNPTYFKFAKLPYGKKLTRECHVNQRFRIALETDAENDYFSRDVDRGEQRLYVVSGGQQVAVEAYALNLYNGICTLSVTLPMNIGVSDELEYQLCVTDPTRIVPFVNEFHVRVRPESQSQPGSARRKKPPSSDEGSEREAPVGIELPTRRHIRQPQWAEEGFNENSAVKALHEIVTDAAGNEHDAYEFLINMDNVHLKRFLKDEAANQEDVRVVETQFDIGLVLIGLGIIHHGRQVDADAEEIDPSEEIGSSILDQVARVTEAVAPIILPLIGILGGLEAGDDAVFAAAGEPT